MYNIKILHIVIKKNRFLFEQDSFKIENNNNMLQSENYFNFVSRDLVELLKLQQPQVIIEPVNIDRVVDHGNKNFNLDKLLDQQFGNERQNEEGD